MLYIFCCTSVFCINQTNGRNLQCESHDVTIIKKEKKRNYKELTFNLSQSQSVKMKFQETAKKLPPFSFSLNISTLFLIKGILWKVT